MAQAYKHKEYFQSGFNDGYFETWQDDDPTQYTFTSVADAQTRCAFHNTYLTYQNPTVTYALEDADKTLVVTFEFDDNEKQMAWKTAVTDLIKNSTAWADVIFLKKIEWLNEDGEVGSTASF